MTSHLQSNAEAWYALREFETLEISSRHYLRRHSLELNAAESREISSSFIQGREYFKSASTAGFTVRPLLIYYGVVSLSRALILYLNPSARETSLKQSHGLTSLGWKQALSDGISGAKDLHVRVTNGTFRELLDATQNKFYFRVNQSKVNWYVGSDVPPLDTDFSLKDIAARVPDLAEQYGAWTGERPPFVTLQSFGVDHESGRCKFELSDTDQKTVERVFPQGAFPSAIVSRRDGHVEITTEDPYPAFFTQKMGAQGLGFVWIYEPLGSGAYFSPIAACYMLSYALGMLCRYFPTSWTMLSRAERGDSFYPIAVRILDWIEESFPQMVVDVLKGPYEFESG